MTDQNFTESFTVSQTPDAAFAAINNVRGWWSHNIDGSTDKLGEAFDYRYQDAHRCTIKVTELAPGKKVAWHVQQNYFSFTKDDTEWTGTDIVFDIEKKGDLTEVRMTHVGLLPENECYEACSQGWSYYMKTSLRDLIATGKGAPNVGEGLTEKERALAS